MSQPENKLANSHPNKGRPGKPPSILCPNLGRNKAKREKRLQAAS